MVQASSFLRTQALAQRPSASSGGDSLRCSISATHGSTNAATAALSGIRYIAWATSILRSLLVGSAATARRPTSTVRG